MSKLLQNRNGTMTDITPNVYTQYHRNVGELVYSLIQLEDAGLHLLDGSLLPANGVYKEGIAKIVGLRNTVSAKSNVTKIGNIADNDGVLSGFSTSNYVELPNKFNPQNKPWEQVIKFTTSSNVTTGQQIRNCTAPSILNVYISGSSKFVLNVGDGSTFNIALEVIGSYTILANTTYWIRLKFTGTAYTLEYSLDGINYIQDISVTSSTPVISHYIRLGLSGALVTPFLGSIDLSGCYISIDGHRWWSGRTTPMFCSEEEWQGSVGLYGVCGKFVYNETDGTLRLPKVTGFVEGTIDSNAIGNLVEAGLPNITGDAGISDGYGLVNNDINNNTVVQRGAFYASQKQKYGNYGNTTTTGYQLGIDASLSNPIYSNSDTVQPQSIKGFLYIVLANSTKTPVQVDIDNIVTDLGNKADVNLTNLTINGQKAMAHAAAPSGQYIDLTLPANGGMVTAPADGWISFAKNTASGETNKYIGLIVSSTQFGSYVVQPSGNAGTRVFVPVRKNDTVGVAYNMTGATVYFRFIYSNGSVPA